MQEELRNLHRAIFKSEIPAADLTLWANSGKTLAAIEAEWRDLAQRAGVPATTTTTTTTGSSIFSYLPNLPTWAWVLIVLVLWFVFGGSGSSRR